MPRSSRPNLLRTSPTIAAKDDHEGEDKVVIGDVALRQGHPGRLTAWPAELEPNMSHERIAHLLHGDAEPEGRQGQEQRRQPRRRDRDKRSQRHRRQAREQHRRHPGQPEVPRKVTMVVAPMAANATWHSDTWPEVPTSRPSDRNKMM